MKKTLCIFLCLAFFAPVTTFAASAAEADGRYPPGEYIINDSETGWKVIDVSYWNGDIDWEKVRADGVKAVIMRLGYRGSRAYTLVEDVKFKAYYDGASKAGLYIGVYFYSLARDVKDAAEEARFTAEKLKEYGCALDFPVYYDIEDRRIEVKSKTECTELVIAFCETIKKEGFYPGVYCNKYWATEKLNMSEFEDCAVWIAMYAKTCDYAGPYGMWQYSETGKVDGIKEYADLNVCYVNYQMLVNSEKENEKPKGGAGAPEQLSGDVNGDGVISHEYARLILRDITKIGIFQMNFPPQQDCGVSKGF